MKNLPKGGAKGAQSTTLIFKNSIQAVVITCKLCNSNFDFRPGETKLVRNSKEFEKEQGKIPEESI